MEREQEMGKGRGSRAGSGCGDSALIEKGRQRAQPGFWGKKQQRPSPDLPGSFQKRLTCKLRLPWEPGRW